MKYLLGFLRIPTNFTIRILCNSPWYEKCSKIFKLFKERERDQREGDWRTYVVGECEQFVWVNHRELIRIPVTTTDTRTCRAQLELIIHRLYIAKGEVGEKLSQSVAWRLSNTNNAASWQLLPFIKHVRRDSCSRKAGERMQGAGSREQGTPWPPMPFCTPFQ